MSLLAVTKKRGIVGMVSFGSGPGIDPIGHQEQKAQIALGTTVFFGGLYPGLVKVGA